MAVKYNKQSTNKDYNDLLKELKIIQNDNDKKNIKLVFNGRKYEYNKYLMIS